MNTGWYHSFEQRAIAAEERCPYIAQGYYLPTDVDLPADRHVASHEPSISDVSGDDVGIVADEVTSDVEILNTGWYHSFEQRTITTEERRPYVSEGHDLPADIDLSAYRYIASRNPHVSNIGKITNHVTQMEGCHYVTERVNLSTDRDVASHHPHVSYVSGVRYHITQQEG